MTNLLTHTLPTRVKTEQGIFEPETDFRASIEFETLVEKGEKDIFKLIKPYYPRGIPKQIEQIEGAINAAIWFYRCGDDTESTENPIAKKRTRSYSFSVDAESIYSDFLRYYDIDLSTVKLHWWKFRALLAGLPSESAFKERIYYRICDLKGLSKKEQNRIRDIRKSIEIKSSVEETPISLEQRNKSMLDYVSKRSKEINKGVE